MGNPWIGKTIVVVFNGDKTSMEGKLEAVDANGIRLAGNEFTKFDRYIPLTAICYIERRL